jgi:YVTN family beta-propeller protein
MMAITITKGDVKVKKNLFTILIFIIVGGSILSGCGQKEKISNEVQETNTNTQNEDSQNDNSSQETEMDKWPSFIFTANEGGSISKIDANTNQVIDTFNVDGLVHNIQVSPNGLLVAATVVPTDGHSHSDSHSSSLGKAQFYDTNTNALIKEVEVGNHPAHIVFTEDGKYALVTNNEDHNVSIIDVKDFTIIKSIQTGNGPHGFRISTDSKFAYIANMGEDTVSVLNLESMVEEKKIKVGSTPVTTAITKDGRQLLATLHTENAVAIVDLETGETTKVPVGKGPAQVYIQPDNQFAFIANQGSEDAPSNSITKIDLASKEVVATIETGEGAHGVVTSMNNQYVYVTNMFENTVSVIDNIQNKVIETISVDEIPNGISVTP